MGTNPTAVVLASGGLDSTVLMHMMVKSMGEDVFVLHFKYGQRHSIESEALFYQMNLLGIHGRVIDLRWWGSLLTSSALTNKFKTVPRIKEVLGHPQPSTYVPFRNLVLLSLAASVAENLKVSRVYYGAQMHDQYGYWDTTPEFASKLRDVWDLNRMNTVQLVTPLIEFSKSQTIREGIELGVEFEHTWSCYSPVVVNVAPIGEPINMKSLACGTCPTCSERLKGFEEVGITDPLEYMDRDKYQISKDELCAE